MWINLFCPQGTHFRRCPGRSLSAPLASLRDVPNSSFLLLFLPWAIALLIFDARTSRLPNWLTLPSIPVAVALSWTIPWANAWAFLGGLAWSALAFGLPLIHHRLFAGAGDAKLALTTGTLAAVIFPPGVIIAVGLSGLMHCIYFAFCSHSFSGLTQWGCRGCTANSARASPHGPAMLMATGVVVVASLMLR